jgi:hypothetical protein
MSRRGAADGDQTHIKKTLGPGKVQRGLPLLRDTGGAGSAHQDQGILWLMLGRPVDECDRESFLRAVQHFKQEASLLAAVHRFAPHGFGRKGRL